MTSRARAARRADESGARLPIREVYRLFGPHLRNQRSRFVLAGLLVLAGAAVGLLKPWPLKFLFDEVLVPGDTPGTAGAPDGPDIQVILLYIVAALAAIALLDSLLSFARSYVMTSLGESVSTAVRNQVYGHLQRLSVRYHVRQRTGDLLTRLTSDVDKVQAIITTTVIEAAANSILLVGMFAVMLFLDWQLSLIMVALFPVLILIVQRFRSRIKRAEAAVRNSEGDLASMAEETLSAIVLVKAYGEEHKETERFRARAWENYWQEMRVLRVSGFFAVALDMVTAVALAGLVWLGAQRVISGALTPGELIIFTAYLRDVISPARSLSKLPAQLAKASVRAEKIAEVLNEVPDVVDRPDAEPAPALSGALELRSVSFGYDAARPVLHDVDLVVRPGETVAVVGATGAGKSTIVGLLLRLFDPDAGTVLADGHDLREFVLTTYQKQIAVVLQQTLLFHASVRQNIAYGQPDATDDAVRAAAMIADADEFIQALPRGYDTVLGERGSSLSGGQRQRIAIARAVLRNARILILDEPTTGLDARSERDVMSAIERASSGRATIIISHQLAAIMRADRIVVLDAGRVVEQGTHDELIANAGRYAHLASLQGLVPALGKPPAHIVDIDRVRPSSN